jgi:hypothetical protein
LAIASFSAFEWFMMRVESVEIFAAVRRWAHVPLFVAVVSIVAFVRSMSAQWSICASQSMTKPSRPPSMPQSPTD